MPAVVDTLRGWQVRDFAAEVDAMKRADWRAMIDDWETTEVNIEDVVNRATEVYHEYDATLPLSPHEEDQDTGKYPKTNAA